MIKKLLLVILIITLLVVALAYVDEVTTTSANKVTVTPYVWHYKNHTYKYIFRINLKEIQYYQKLKNIAKNNYLYYITPYNPLLKTLSESLYFMAIKTGVSYQNLTIAFVQNIQYKSNLHLNFPVVTLAYGYGDCGSKSILLANLLYMMGNNVVLIYEPYQDHMLVGLAGNYSGANIKYGVLTYYTIETTVSSAIGAYPLKKGAQLLPVYYSHQYTVIRPIYQEFIEFSAVFMFTWFAVTIIFSFMYIFFPRKIHIYHKH